MKNKIETVQKTRSFFLNSISDLSVDELNETPPGFNNNIIWNLGHLIAAQQGICYLRSGLQPAVGIKYFEAYKTGTRPEHFVNAEEVEKIKGLFLTSLSQFASDFESRLFLNYTTFTTRYGVTITNIEDAFNFVPFHEGLHYGYTNALKRIIKKVL